MILSPERLIEFAIRVGFDDWRNDEALVRRLFYSWDLRGMGADMTPPGGPPAREMLVTDRFMTRIRALPKREAEEGKGSDLFAIRVPTVEEIIDLIARMNLNCIHGYPQGSKDVPCISITLGNGDEEPWMGNRRDTLRDKDGVEYELKGSDWKTQYSVSILSTNYDEVWVMHKLLNYSFGVYRGPLEAFGMRDQRLTWADLEPASEYVQAGMFAYQRVCTFAALITEDYPVKVQGYTDLEGTVSTLSGELVASVGVVAGSESSDSTPAPPSPPTAPLAPTGLAGTRDGEHANLNWNASVNALSYRVWRSVVTGGPYAFVTNVQGTSFQDSGLLDQPYFYVVSAVGEIEESGYSAEVRVDRSFSPGHLPGLLYWFDADAQFVEVDGSDRVTRWLDRSGNGNHAFPQGAPAPLWQANQVNGLPAVSSTGGGGAGYLSAADVTGPSATFFIVFKVRTLVGGLFQVAQSNVTPGTKYAVLHSNNLLQWYTAGADPNEDLGGLGADNTWHVLTITADQGTQKANAWLDGAQVLTDGQYTGPIDLAGAGMLFLLSGYSQPCDGLLAEFMGYDGALDPTDRLLVENLLRTKYGQE